MNLKLFIFLSLFIFNSNKSVTIKNESDNKIAIEWSLKEDASLLEIIKSKEERKLNLKDEEYKNLTVKIHAFDGDED